ncbi:hypothetical protein JCM8208_005667 [Rhodotorula glutinis]
MCDRPVAPAVPDVFSSPSPPRSPSPSTTTPLSDTEPPLLAPVTLDWVNASASSFGDDQALQPLVDEDNSGRSANSHTSGEQRDAFPDFLPRPSTPSASPFVAQHVGGLSVAPSSAYGNLFRTPIKPGVRERSNLSPESPSFNPVVGSSSCGTTPTRLEPPFKPVFRFDHLDKSTSDPATPLRFSAFEHGSPWTPDRAKPTVAPSPWTWPPRNVKPDEDLKLHYREPVYPSIDSPSRHCADEHTPTKVGRFASSSSSLLLDSTSPPRKPDSTSAPVATRYVLVEGLRCDLSERDLREMLLPRCSGLSVRDCYTGRLRVHGEVVLLFHDVRHALAASRLVQFDQSGQLALKARCITHKAFEQLVGHGQASALVSRSEGVLVLTLVGTPTSSPTLAPVSLLAQFGEVRALKVVEERFHVVEYWDDRAAERAHEILDGREQGGARFECSFEPNVASTDPPSWTTTATATTSKNVVAPLDPFFPPTPVATPRSTTSFDLAYLSPPAPASTFSFGSAALAKPFTPSTAPVSAQSQSRWTASFLPPVGPAGFLHLGPASPPPSQRHQQQSSLASSVQPGTVTASTTSTALADGPRAAASLPAWPVKHRSHIGQEYGIVRDDRIPASNVLNFERIERGLDVRTTVMIKNIPNKLKDYEVMAFIEEVVGRSFDFFYLRTDYSNDCNVGYGFCNFTSTAALLAFAKARLGTRWNLCASDKLCVLSYANIQGKASLINHFRNSSVLDQAENRRPKLFVTSGPHAGEPEPFPVCDDPVRKARSALNASSVGLFPAQRPVFKLAQAFQGVGIGETSPSAS